MFRGVAVCRIEPRSVGNGLYRIHSIEEVMAGGADFPQTNKPEP